MYFFQYFVKRLSQDKLNYNITNNKEVHKNKKHSQIFF